MEEFMLPCLNKQLFGLDCLGCGTQRAFWLLLQGEFVAAFKMYPAVYAISLLILFLIADFFFKFRYSWQIKIALILLSAAIIIGSYLIKINHIF